MLTGHIARGGIVLGIHAGTPYYDCSPTFVTATDRLVAEHTDGPRFEGAVTHLEGAFEEQLLDVAIAQRDLPT